MSNSNPPLKLAVVRDFREEGWPSMDLLADMLLEQLRADPRGFTVEEIAPRFRRVLGSMPGIGSARASRNFDRLWNRFLTLGRAARSAANRYDAFHIVDHSHSHLVHALPAERTGICCCDLDTFRCLLEPEKEPRSIWFRAMARRILSGMQKAAVVFYISNGTRDGLLSRKLVAPEKLRYLPLGVAPEFSPAQCEAEARAALRAHGLEDTPYILHVGSCIPRKRIEFLLELFAELRRDRPNLVLAKIGDAWTEAQAAQVEKLGIGSAIRHLGRLPREQLIDVIRGAATVVIPSDAEGFGLPVVEALACGVPVVASDIPPLREAGGDAARYAPVGDLARWTEALAASFAAADDPTERGRRREWTSQFTWQRYANTIADTYHELLAADYGSRIS